MEVDIEMQWTIFLLDEWNQYTIQRWDWLDEIYIEVFLNKFLQSLLFGCRKRVYGATQRLSIFFQINFEVIGTMRSENFSFSFAKNINEFMILRRDIRKVRGFHKFCKISLNVWRTKTKFKITGAQKFWCVQECYSTNNDNVRLLGVRYRGLRLFLKYFLCLLLVNLLLLTSLEERSTYRILGYFLEIGNKDDFKEEILVDEATRDRFALFWKAIIRLEVEGFSYF